MKKIIFCITFMCFAISCTKNQEIEINCTDLPSYDSYVYPIQPGTPEWAKLQSGDEMFAACQIPDETLSKMSTEGLIVSAINHPMYLQIYAHNFLQNGYDDFVKRANVFSALENRQDAGQKLLEAYKRIQPACINEQPNDMAKSNFSFKLELFELLIAQNPYTKTLSLTEQKNLVKEALNKYEEKNKIPELYGGHSMSIFVCTKVMLLSNYQPFMTEYNQNENLRHFVNTANHPIGTETAPKIINLSKSFVLD